MKPTTIDGAIITDSVIEQIKDWQEYGNLNMDVNTIEQAIDLIFEREDIQDNNCPDAVMYLHLVKKLRDLSKSLQKFKINGNHEQSN